MEPLSERILEIAETEIIGADIFEKWAAEVAALEARIEALEREREHYRSNVDRWAEELAARDARIEELEKVVREVASAGVSFTDVRLWYDEVQMPKETLVEARRLTAIAAGKKP